MDTRLINTLLLISTIIIFFYYFTRPRKNNPPIIKSKIKSKILKIILNIGFVYGIIVIGVILLFIYTLSNTDWNSRESCRYEIYTKTNIKIFQNYYHSTTNNSCPDLEENSFYLKNGEIFTVMD